MDKILAQYTDVYFSHMSYKFSASLSFFPYALGTGGSEPFKKDWKLWLLGRLEAFVPLRC